MANGFSRDRLNVIWQTLVGSTHNSFQIAHRLPTSMGACAEEHLFEDVIHKRHQPPCDKAVSYMCGVMS